MRISQQAKIVAALGLVIILGLAGCAKPAPTTTPTPTPTPTPAPAPTPTPTPTPATTGPYEELRIAISSLGGEVLDPIKGVQTATQNCLGPFMELLIMIDKAGRLAPRVADKWEIATDGLSWTYYIHKGTKFHNGEDLTATDVKFSLERYMLKDALYADMRTAINRMEIVDDYTLRIYTNGLQPYLPYQNGIYPLGQGIVMLKDYIEQHGMDYFLNHPICSGPFKLVRHIPGDSLEYEAVDNHWRRVPDFKNLTIILIPEEATRMAMLKTGEIDAIDLGIEASREAIAAGCRIAKLESMEPNVCLWGALHPDAAKMPIADVRVRQALSLAINRDESRDSFFYGQGSPLMPPNLNLNSADVNIAYWKDYAAKAYRYDPAEATRLLKEAGYPDGFSIKLFVANIRGSPYLPKLGEVTQGYWGKIGVKAQIVPMDWGALQPLRVGPQPQLMGQASMYRWASGPVTVQGLRQIYHSKGGHSSMLTEAMPEVDKLLDQAMGETDAKKRGELLAKVIQTGTDLYVSLALPSAPSLVAISPRVDWELPDEAHSLCLFTDTAKHSSKK